jgi:hypothetical protein
MKPLFFGTAALLALVVPGSIARATPFDFTYTGSVVDFTVLATDSYQILAFGAQGGDYTTNGNVTGPGGLGAEIGGDFNLTAGEVLQVAVGGAGMSGVGVGGGGGGSFVVGPGDTPLVIAAGGGGGGILLNPFTGMTTGDPGEGGLTGLNGGSTGGPGGTNGNGGGAGDFLGQGPPGGGGGGFFSAGGNAIAGGTGGGAFEDPILTLAGGTPGGGFGGGGGGPAGGGGYSGGSGGTFHGITGAFPEHGGGGGSFDAGTDPTLVADFQSGNGEVVITEIAAVVPEPASIALLGASVAGLVAALRLRRPNS